VGQIQTRESGRYYSFFCVIQGKDARPVPIAEAQKACEKLHWPETFGHQTHRAATDFESFAGRMRVTSFNR
jgi:hypothetical protein